MAADIGFELLVQVILDGADVRLEMLCFPEELVGLSIKVAVLFATFLGLLALSLHDLEDGFEVRQGLHAAPSSKLTILEGIRMAVETDDVAEVLVVAVSLLVGRKPSQIEPVVEDTEAKRPFELRGKQVVPSS